MKDLVFAGLLLAAGLVQPASASPVVYDFETGAQGWTTGSDGTTSIGVGTGGLNTWFLGALGLGPTTWVNPNTGEFGAERSWVQSPIFIVDSPWSPVVQLSFDSYSFNEGGYPSTFDVEHVQMQVNGGGFFDMHGFDANLHNGADGVIRSITYSALASAGDVLEFRFLYDTGDACCGPGEPNGWAFDNVEIQTVPEPGSLLLLGSGMALTANAWRKRRQPK